MVSASGFDVRLDAEPLTPLEELLAISGGRLTYTRHPSGAVHVRNARVIRARPAGSGRSTVHAEHRCPEADLTP